MKKNRQNWALNLPCYFDTSNFLYFIVLYIDSALQDYGNSIVNVLELPQFFTKPLNIMRLCK